MNLEELEQKTLAYLSQSSNPMVRMHVLHEHLSRELDLSSYSQDDLRAFLVAHDQIRTMQPLPVDEDMGDALDDAGLFNDECAMLTARVPTREQLAAMMLEQIDRMGEALGNALVEARESGNEDGVRHVTRALDRASKLRRKLLSFHGGEVEPNTNGA